MESDVPYPRFLSRGRAYAYLLPCRDQDLAKVGFSRDPLTRLNDLHRRFFEFFDLERAVLLETATVRQARAVERDLIETLAELRAPAPLEARALARGDTEWHRGAYPLALERLETAARAHGYALHLPLGDWLRAHFGERADRLYQWSSRMLEADEYERHNAPPELQTRRCARALRNALDAHRALGIDVERLVPEAVWAWFTTGDGYSGR
jgi:hypothetical protein